MYYMFVMCFFFFFVCAVLYMYSICFVYVQHMLTNKHIRKYVKGKKGSYKKKGVRATKEENNNYIQIENKHFQSSSVNKEIKNWSHMLLLLMKNIQTTYKWFTIVVLKYIYGIMDI